MTKKNNVTVSPSRGGKNLSFCFSKDIANQVKKDGKESYFAFVDRGFNDNLLERVTKKSKGARMFQTNHVTGHMEIPRKFLKSPEFLALKKVKSFKVEYREHSGSLQIDVPLPKILPIKIVPKPGRGDCVAESASFQKDLRDLINWYSLENGSDSPDWVLAQYLMTCLKAYERAIMDRAKYNKGLVA